MRFNPLLISIFLVGAISVRAIDPLYTIQLKSDEKFDLVVDRTSINRIDFFPSNTAAAQKSGQPDARKVIASGYQSGVRIKTQKPDLAVQGIIRQIGQQTGLMLATRIDSTVAARTAPAVLQLSYSETSVINLLLVPKDDGTFVLTCDYVIYSRPEGSIDGTPAATANMEEQMRRLDADSVAIALPEKIRADELKLEDYYRPASQIGISDQDNHTVLVMALMLKKGSDYSIAFYQSDGTTWARIDQPMQLLGTHPPGYSGLTILGHLHLSVRAKKLNGVGGYDVSLQNGRLIKQEFSD
jgi:hypothetical protein